MNGSERAVDFSALQMKARGQLKGNMWAIWLGGLACGFILSVVLAAGAAATFFVHSFDSEYWLFITIGAVFVSALVLWFFFAAMRYGNCASMNTMYLGGKSKVKISLSGFKRIFGAFSVSFLVWVLTFLWSLLFVIPGLVKVYSYSCAMYIKQEDPSKGALQCITESRQIMKGYKLEKLLFSAYVWQWFLVLATCGLFLLYIIPYRKQANYNFYQNAKANMVKAEEPCASEAVATASPTAHHGVPMQGLNVQNTVIQDAIAQQAQSQQPAPAPQPVPVPAAPQPAPPVQFQPAPQSPPNGVLAQNVQQQQQQQPAQNPPPPVPNNTNELPLHRPVFPQPQPPQQPPAPPKPTPAGDDDTLDGFF